MTPKERDFSEDGMKYTVHVVDAFENCRERPKGFKIVVGKQWVWKLANLCQISDSNLANKVLKFKRRKLRPRFW